MSQGQPDSISTAEQESRLHRVQGIARQMGFVGQVRYEHVSRRSGGAQYIRGASAEEDRLVVDADAFARNANPEDFFLEAMIAHERGHQLLFRHPRVRRTLAPHLNLVSEEIVASIVGSLIVAAREDRDLLMMKASFEAGNCGLSNEAADRLITNLRDCLEDML